MIYIAIFINKVFKITDRANTSKLGLYIRRVSRSISFAPMRSLDKFDNCIGEILTITKCH